MTEIGYVVAVDDKLATVEINRASACEGCHKQSQPGGCSACSLLGGDKKMRAIAINSCGAVVGDKVKVSASSARTLLYGFIVFLLPILFGLALYFVASAFTESDITRTWCAIIGFIVAIICVGVYSYIVSKRNVELVITKVIS